MKEVYFPILNSGGTIDWQTSKEWNTNHDLTKKLKKIIGDKYGEIQSDQQVVVLFNADGEIIRLASLGNWNKDESQRIEQIVREYLQGELTTPLVAGTTYEVETWVTLADKMAVGTNNIGVKFSTNPYTHASSCGYYTTPDLNYTGPTILDKQNWVQIIFCYTPTTAGLDNFIIGNFYNDGATATAAASGVTTSNTIRHYVEDVRVEAISPGGGNAGTDGAISLCSSDPSVDLFSSLGGAPDMTGTWSGSSTLGGATLAHLILLRRVLELTPSPTQFQEFVGTCKPQQ